MVQADLLTRAMEAASLEGPVARKAVEALFESLATALGRGDRVVRRRFGLFRAAPRRISATSLAAVEGSGACPRDGWTVGRLFISSLSPDRLVTLVARLAATLGPQRRHPT